jgi:hypothetical protein
MKPHNRITREIRRVLFIVLPCALAVTAQSSHARDAGPAKLPTSSTLGVTKPVPPYIVGAGGN